MTEREQAIGLATRVLDRPSADPDDDLAVLARQLLRRDEHIAAALVELHPAGGDIEITHPCAKRIWRTIMILEGKEVPPRKGNRP